ncbi:endonuclease/exonuclease/phosphatase family protein [Cellulomonas sp. HZM]|uniref:endonuclease/exonuclease/phosphatase family protein n=1 Tax=Cellulomonas sp. HZM TaxID=1454010 RepID=UPI000493707D|nr:endonuclease/exonuclease/phosphatase family protein [Cellulomonas sp. HZM]
MAVLTPPPPTRTSTRPPGPAATRIEPRPGSVTTQRSTHARRRRGRFARLVARVVASIAAVVAMSVCVVLLTTPTPPLPAPSAPGAIAVSHHSFGLTWTAVPGATSYRVRVATDPAMSRVVWQAPAVSGTLAVVAGPHVYEHTDYYASVQAVAGSNVSTASEAAHVQTGWQSPGPVTGTTTDHVDVTGFTLHWSAAPLADRYLVTVRAGDEVVTEQMVRGLSLRVAARDGRAYTATVLPARRTLTGPAGSAKVTTPVKKVGKPGKPFVEPVSTSSLDVRWGAATDATGYSVQLLATPKGKPVATATSSKPEVTLQHVDRAKLGSVFWVRITSNRFGLSTARSKPVPTTLLPGTPGRSRSFTATFASYNLLKPSETDAEKRSWQKRYAVAGAALRGVDVAGLQETPWKKFNGKRPVQVVAKKAGLVVAKHPHSSKPCTTTSEPILYRASKFTVVHCGVDQLATKGPKRYASWALLKERESGRTVLVTSAHLVAYAGTSSSRTPAVQKQRAVQAKRLVKAIAKHNAHESPVVVLGDLNTYPNRATVTPLDVLASAGYAPSEMTAPQRTDAQYASFHGFQTARTTGQHFDQVIVDGRSVVEAYAVKVTDPARAPSDHFQVRAKIAVH